MENLHTFVSVVMPVYNGEKYLREAIDSILNQTYSNFEFIIINDGSSDKSEQIITSYNDNRIIYISNTSNIRLIATLNKGLQLAKGDYIVRMDQDDISMPHRIEIQVAFMNQHPEYVLAGSYVSTIDSFGVELGSIAYYTEDTDLRFAMTQYCPFVHPSVIIRSFILRDKNIFYEKVFLHAEDYRLWTILSSFGKIKNLPECLLHYRVHLEQTSNVHKAFQIKQMQLIQENYLSSLFPNYSSEIVSLVFLRSNLKEKDEVNIKDLRNFMHEIYDNIVHSALHRFLIKRWKAIIQSQKKYSLLEIFTILFFKITWKSRWSLIEIILLISKIRVVSHKVFK